MDTKQLTEALQRDFVPSAQIRLVNYHKTKAYYFRQVIDIAGLPISIRSSGVEDIESARVFDLDDHSDCKLALLLVAHHGYEVEGV